MIEIEMVYTFTCDWPSCPEKLKLRGSSKIGDATDRARREGWTLSKKNGERRYTGDHTRCPSHAYRFVRKPTGRPRKRAA